MIEEKHISNCKNCYKELPWDALFCPYCRQSTKDKKISLKNLFVDFFSHFVFFDFKIFRSFLAILIPGKLTKEYFIGKHGAYSSPWRLFFVSIILMLLAVSINDRIEGSNVKDIVSFNKNKVSDKWLYYKSDDLQTFNLDTIKKVLKEKGTTNEEIDSLVNLIENAGKYIDVNSLLKNITNKNIDNNLSKVKLDENGFDFAYNSDSISIPKQKIKQIKINLDTLRNKISDIDLVNIKLVFTGLDSIFYSLDSNHIVKQIIDSTAYVLNQQLKDIYIDSTTVFDSIRVSDYDIENLSIGEVKSKYGIQSHDQSFIAKKSKDFFYKANAKKFNSEKLIDFLYRNLNWFIVFLMPFAALIFKLLYFRRKRYFVEHLVFNMHNHTAVLLLFTLIIIISWILSEKNADSIYGPIYSFGPGLYYLLAMKKYYDQSWLKTIFKSFIFAILYGILIIIMIILYSAIGYLSTIQ